MEVATTRLPPNTGKSYLGQAFSAAKNYARHSYHLSYLYGKVRGIAQPWISTKFNVHQIYNGVYIGDIESASNIKELKALGITHIVTAILGVSPQFPKDFTYLNIPVMDVETENMTPYLDQASFFIDSAIGHGGKVLVHCMCGVSRSATIVAAWIITRNRGNVDDTIRMIREKRACVNPNPAFRSQLASFSETASLYTGLLHDISKSLSESTENPIQNARDLTNPSKSTPSLETKSLPTLPTATKPNSVLVETPEPDLPPKGRGSTTQMLTSGGSDSSTRESTFLESRSHGESTSDDKDMNINNLLIQELKIRFSEIAKQNIDEEIYHDPEGDVS